MIIVPTHLNPNLTQSGHIQAIIEFTTIRTYNSWTRKYDWSRGFSTIKSHSQTTRVIEFEPLSKINKKTIVFKPNEVYIFKKVAKRKKKALDKWISWFVCLFLEVVTRRRGEVPSQKQETRRQKRRKSIRLSVTLHPLFLSRVSLKSP